jgi:hypothetical protein
MRITGGGTSAMGGDGNSFASLPGHDPSAGYKFSLDWLALRCFNLRDRTRKKAAANNSPAPKPKPTAKPAIRPVFELLLDVLLARGRVELLAAALDTGLIVNDVSEVLVTSLDSYDCRQPWLARPRIKLTIEVVGRAKPSNGCAYAWPEVEKNITPLELLLSYCVTDVLRISLKQVPP